MPRVRAEFSSELKHDSAIDTYFRLLCQHEILKVIGLPSTANSPLVYRSIAGRLESQHRANRRHRRRFWGALFVGVCSRLRDYYLLS